jgi:hypothetical protein
MPRPKAPPSSGQAIRADMIAADLIAVVVAFTTGEPRVLTVSECGAEGLPAGPLEHGQPSLQSGLRAWVERQTHHPLGYVEQLYTFADRARAEASPDTVAISISYLGLTREVPAPGGAAPTSWQGWYRYFPWEDRRLGPPALIAGQIAPALRDWARHSTGRAAARDRLQRAALTFGLDDQPWNDELVLQRYELLYEAGLVPEAASGAPPIPGARMRHDHRRILATGIARLRAKIRYRPVVFELMPASFTLLQLQRAVEALAGQLVHKQNFRRLVEQQELVEETGQMTMETGGRPAKLFCFRRAVLQERAAGGTKPPLARTAALPGG